MNLIALFWRIMLYTVGFALSLVTLQPLTANARGPNWTATEKSVLEQVARGKVADLEAREDRSLSAKFVEQLLTGQIEDLVIHRRGIRIRNAVIKKSLDLRNAVVSHEVWLNNCQFRDRVDLSYAEFRRRINFSRSAFTNSEKAAFFYGMQVGGDVLFSDVRFEGPVDFRTAEVQRIFSVRKSHFASERTTNFRGIHVGGNFQANEAVFEGNANLEDSVVEGDFSATGSKFRKAAAFNSLKIGKSCNLIKATFEGNAYFRRLSTTENLVARNASFKGKTSLERMRIGGSADFSQAEFEGPADFEGCRVKETLTATGASFSQSTTFDQIHIEGSGLFYLTTFGGPVSFVSANITGSLGALKTQFKDSANFNSIRVGGVASLDNSVFDGQVNFGSAKIEGQLQADSTRFNSTRDAQFYRMDVGDAVYFKWVIFEGTADFHNTQIGSNLEFDGTHFARSGNFKGIRINGVASFLNMNFGSDLSFSEGRASSLLLSGVSPSPILSTLDLSSMQIDNALSIKNLHTDTLRANSIRVNGEAILDTVIHVTNLENASFSKLVLSRLPWATHQEDLRLQGMTYTRIQAHPSNALVEWRRLLYWINHSSFSPQTYTQLENFFKNERDRERANEVFLTRKRRETHELRYSFTWFWNQLLDLTVRYGRAPERILVLAIVVILIGAVIFRDHTIEPRSKEDEGNFFRSLWYSVDVFFPGFLDLKLESVWQPKDHQGFRNHYARFQKIIGWLLIIITMSVIGGMIR